MTCIGVGLRTNFQQIGTNDMERLYCHTYPILALLIDNVVSAIPT